MKQSDRSQTAGTLPLQVHKENTRLIQEITELLKDAGRRELEITRAFVRSLMKK